MIQQTLTACAAAIAIALPLSAHAQFVVGAPIIIPTDHTLVTLQFVSFEAVYTGEISFLGSGTVLLVDQPVADTGEPGMGQQAFINQVALPGAQIVLEGTYDAGEVLHFAYRVFEPVGASDLLRTADVETATQFAWDAEAGLLHVEDLRPGHPWYDADYNDLVIRVSFNTAPGPGSAALLAVAGCVGFGRRRRGQ